MWTSPRWIPHVGRLRLMFATALLSLWFGATLNCGLKAADVFDEGADISCGFGSMCGKDACHVIENGDRTGTETLKLSAPSLDLACSCCTCLRMASLLGELGRVVAEPDVLCPLDWVPIRHFEQRTALPSRAPTLLVA